VSDPNASPTLPPPQPEGLNSALSRNIQALKARRDAEDAAAGFGDRLSDRVTAFTGSLAFVAIHVVIVAAWVAINIGFLPWPPPFDRSFVILATAASVEAIFLSTFVLISQNRAAAAANRRADLDLQINLLAEHEVTRLITLTSQIAAHLGVEALEPEIRELERDVAPEAVLDTLEASEKDARRRR
jgi:uncharacterized membrane protein